MNTIREALGFNLRILRGNRTQAEMAEFLGLPHGSYQRLESASVFPRPETLALLCERLGVSEASLVQLPGESPPVSPEVSRLALIGSIAAGLSALEKDELGRIRDSVAMVLLARGIDLADLEEVRCQEK